MSIIPYGTRVRIVWECPREGEIFEDVTLSHAPQEPGDMWGFDRDDGTSFLLNPYSPTLEGIFQLPKDEEVGVAEVAAFVAEGGSNA